MPPRRKRKISSGEDADRNKRTRETLKQFQPSVLYPHHQNNFLSNNSSNQTFSEKRCSIWFYEYVRSGEDSIGPEGMEQFCEDIGVEPENIVMLVLAWKLGAKQMGFFTKEEWFHGMSQLQADNIPKLRARLEYLRGLLNDPPTFKKIYRYAFDFARDKDQRSLDIDTAKAMLTLLLGKRWSIFNSFHQFLEQSRYKVLNKDQWCNILEFSRAIHPNLSNYDEDGAWPVLLDEFVAWVKLHSS